MNYFLVARTGFEPMISALRGRRPKPARRTRRIITIFLIIEDVIFYKNRSKNKLSPTEFQTESI